MDNQELIPAEECCTYYHIDYSFIHSLQQSNLIELVAVEEKSFVPSSQLHDLEKYIRLHYDLDINIEGIETVAHLLERMQALQHENLLLKRQLRSFGPQS